MERGKPAKISEWSTYLWNESHNEFGAKVTEVKFGNSQRSLLSPTGGVKSIPPNTEENWIRKLYNETKCETNYSINNKWNNYAQQAPHQARHQ